MDYEKKYKDALERARNIRFGNPNSALANVVCEEIFPEIRESEDERIRKELIRFFSKGAEYDSSTNGIKDRNIIAWLEKQGETFTKKDVDDAYLKGICDAKRELEKQGEQKPTWSEEDESMLKDAIEFIDTGWTFRGKSHLVYWLKSIKNRIQPQ